MSVHLNHYSGLTVFWRALPFQFPLNSQTPAPSEVMVKGYLYSHKLCMSGSKHLKGFHWKLSMFCRVFVQSRMCLYSVRKLYMCSDCMSICVYVCVCVLLGVRLGTIYRGLLSSGRTELWDSIRLPCITACRQLQNSYFWSWNKAACEFLPQQIFCVCTCTMK